jgi:hypothetical protein
MSGGIVVGSGILVGTLLVLCISFGLWQHSYWAGLFCFALIVVLLHVGLEVIRLVAWNCDPDLEDDV